MNATDQDDIQRLSSARAQFSLTTLFGFTAICGLLMLGSDIEHAAPTFLLIAMALALAVGRGGIAMLMLAGAILTSEIRTDAMANDPGAGSVLFILFKAGLVIWWYCYRASDKAPIDCEPEVLQVMSWDEYYGKHRTSIFHNGGFGK